MTTLGALAVAAVLACEASAAAPPPAAGEQEAAAIAAAMRRAAGIARDYKISPADLISVTVYGEQDLGRKVRVNASGMVFLPLAGAVEVGGKTLDAAQQVIAGKLASYMLRPQVSLFIEEYGNKLVFVLGEVLKPGSYPMPAESRVTLLEAISMAGGFSPVAATGRTRVLRYVNGQSAIYTVDVGAITSKGEKSKDLYLEPNDVVYVPQSLF